MISRTVAACALALASFTSVAAGQSQGDAPRYEVIDLGSSNWGLALPNDINEHRVSVGSLDSGNSIADGRHAVRWSSDGTLTDLTTDANIQLAYANAINDAGVIVGRLITKDAAPEGGFRWAAGTLEVLPSAHSQFAEDIDERGSIVGMAHTPQFAMEPTIWNRGLNYVQLGTLGGSAGTGYDIDGWGRVVGMSDLKPGYYDGHAILWRDGSMVDLGVLPGHADSAARGINNRGYVVGRSGPYLAERAFDWTAQQGLQDLGDLGFAPRAAARDVNYAGTAVGYSYRQDGVVGVVWFDGQIHDLNQLIDPASGWALRSAEGINERGDIVGTGYLPDGKNHAYLAIRKDGGNLVTLGPNPGFAGGLNQVEVLGATAGSEVILALGHTAGSTVLPGCAQVVVDIDAPRLLTAFADAQGQAVFQVELPAGAAGRRLLLQTAERDACRVSNLVVRLLD